MVRTLLVNRTIRYRKKERIHCRKMIREEIKTRLEEIEKMTSDSKDFNEQYIHEIVSMLAGAYSRDEEDFGDLWRMSNTLYNYHWGINE